MLKYFPQYQNKFTGDSICLTVVPDRLPVLLSQRRRWINSTIHNLFELLFLPQLCGCLCFSMRFVVFLDLFATLIMPASVGYLGYLIAASIMSQTAPTISLIMLGVAYGLQAVIFIVKGEFQHIGWMIISILALPIFSFGLPLYAYWHFDDFSWGSTRRIAGVIGDDGGGHGGGGEEFKFDPNAITCIPWKDVVSGGLGGGGGAAAAEDNEEDAKVSRSNKKKKKKGPASSVSGSSTYSNETIKTSSTPALGGGGKHTPNSFITIGSTSSMSGNTPLNLHSGVVPLLDMNRHYQMQLEQLEQYRLSLAAAAAASTTTAPNTADSDIPGDERIKDQIRIIINTTPMEQLTKKKVRELLEVYFGCKLGLKKEMINSFIVECVEVRK